MRRTIRLSEHIPNQDIWSTPSDTYMSTMNTSLEQRPYRIRTDRHGFLSTGTGGEIEKGSIILLGDSVIENYWIEENSRAAALLENDLNKQGYKIRVLNGGVSGASSLHISNSILAKCIPLRPRMIVVMTGVIDKACEENGGYWSSNPHYSPVSDHPTFSEGESEDRVRLLRIMQSACREFDIEFIAATFPHAEPGRNQINNVTLNYGGTVIDIEYELSGRQELFYDHIHVNKRGARVLASALLKAIIPFLDK